MKLDVKQDYCAFRAETANDQRILANLYNKINYLKHGEELIVKRKNQKNDKEFIMKERKNLNPFQKVQELCFVLPTTKK